MKVFNLLVVVLLSISFAIVGCSKEESYTLEQDNTFEVGTDIPEGAYKIEILEEKTSEKEKDNYTTIIGDEDNPNAVFTDISNMEGKTINLKKDQIVSSDGNIKLISVKK